MAVQRPATAGERLGALIQIPTVSAFYPTEGTDSFRRLAEQLEVNWPLTHQHLEREWVGEIGLLYRWPGRASDRPLVLMAHGDVVPADQADGWDYDPFLGAVRDGWVLGRGALDDKGALASIMEAVESLLESGFEPEQDIYLAFGGDEERFGDTASTMAALLADRGIHPFLVLDEGGAVVDAPLPGISVPLAVIGVAEKGITSLRLSTDGPAGHASAPTPASATRRLVRALERIERRPVFPGNVPEIGHGLLRSVAPHAARPLSFVYRHSKFFAPILRRAFDKAGGEAAALLRTTVALTVLRAGDANNVIPALASAVLNLRIAPGMSVDEAVAAIRRRINDPAVRIEILEADEPSPISPSGFDGEPEDVAAWQLLSDAVAAGYPDAVTAPYLMVAASDARHYHRHFPRVYRFAPLRMQAEQLRSIHGLNEAVSESSLESAREVYAALIRGVR